MASALGSAPPSPKLKPTTRGNTNEESAMRNLIGERMKKEVRVLLPITFLSLILPPLLVKTSSEMLKE